METTQVDNCALKESTMEYFMGRRIALFEQAETITGIPFKAISEGLTEMAPQLAAPEVQGGHRLFTAQELRAACEKQHPGKKTDLDKALELVDKINLEKCQLEFAIQFTDLFMDEKEEISVESLNGLLRTAYQYDALMERMGPINTALRKAARVGDKATQAVVHAARKGAQNSQRVKVVAQRIPKHIDDLITNTVGQLKRLDHAERRNRLLQGGTRVKLFRLIKNAILLGGVAALTHPAVAAIGLIGVIAADKKLDSNAKKRLLNELEDELKLVDEKINDARNAGDNEKKYQLMRIKNSLDGEIRRIQYNLVK